MSVKRFLPLAAAVVVAIVAALAVNVLLVGASDRNDPVGNLSPRAPLTSTDGSTSTEARPGRTTTRETPTSTEDTTTVDETTTEEDDDDSSGRGRGRNRGRGGDGSEDDD